MLLLQSDGSIVSAGETTVFRNISVSVKRTLTSGALDTTFMTSGLLTHSISTGADYIYGGVLQTDGKIIVVGQGQAATIDFALARYNTDGSIDTSFRTTGRFLSSFGAGTETAYAAIIQTDDKVIAVGFGGSVDFALARYNTNGTFDTSFKTTGSFLSPIGASNDIAYAAVIQSDGKIILVGNSLAGNSDFSLARYNTDGSFDTTFKTAGKFLSTIGSSSDIAYAVVLQTDGKIIAAGYANVANYDFALGRYTSDGQFDTTFNTNGKVTTAIGASQDTIYKIVIQTDGKIIATGLVMGSNADFGLARYLTDGKLDTSFKTTGKIILSLDQSERIRGAVVLTDGRIAVAGDSQPAPVLFLTDGNLDTAFLTAGKAYHSYGSHSYARAIAIDSTGKAIMFGAANTTRFGFSVSRFENNGSLDSSFYTSGALVTTLSTVNDYAYAGLIQTDGKIVAVGFFNTAASAIGNFELARYETSGKLDTSFRTSGKMMATDLGGYGKAYAAILQTDGKVVALGFVTASYSNFGLMRFTTDGQFDTSFKTSGLVNHSLTSYYEYVYAAVLQTDGKVVAVGSSLGTNGNSDSDFALVRYTSDGRVDTTFWTNGILYSSISSAADVAYAAALQTDGKIIAAGYGTGTDIDFAVGRYTTDGRYDTTFNTTGKLMLSVSTISDIAYTVNVQKNGKILLAGAQIINSTSGSYLITRLKSDGRLDSTFFSSGKIISSIYNGGDFLYASSIDSRTGYNYLAGSTTKRDNFSFQNSGSQLLLMRLAP